MSKRKHLEMDELDRRAVAMVRERWGMYAEDLTDQRLFEGCQNTMFYQMIRLRLAWVDIWAQCWPMLLAVWIGYVAIISAYALWLILLEPLIK